MWKQLLITLHLWKKPWQHTLKASIYYDLFHVNQRTDHHANTYCIISLATNRSCSAFLHLWYSGTTFVLSLSSHLPQLHVDVQKNFSLKFQMLNFIMNRFNVWSQIKSSCTLCMYRTILFVNTGTDKVKIILDRSQCAISHLSACVKYCEIESKYHNIYNTCSRQWCLSRKAISHKTFKLSLLLQLR